jgi:HD superfamily phosphohydrolase YqeK
LLAWIESTDFYSAPASTKFHGNHEGGLLEHSLNVYDALKELVKQFQEIEVSEESIAIAALFHDLCKANYYAVGTKNVKDEQTGQWHKEPFYKAEDQFPVGHGEKSVIILLQYMKLTDEEIYAIRWHMSGFDSAVKGGDFGCSKAYDMCPFAVLLHLADMEATYLMEERSV